MGDATGLKCRLQPSEPAPEFFTDELLKRSSHWTLSTSQVVGDLFDVYGWGAVVPDGYGALTHPKSNEIEADSRAQAWLTSFEASHCSSR